MNSSILTINANGILAQILILLGSQCFGTFWSKTLPKPWRVPRNPKFWCLNVRGSKKKSKKIRAFGRLQNFGILLYFLRLSSTLAHQNSGFLDFSVFWEHLGAQPCQHHGGSRKTKFWCQKVGGSWKKQKTKVSGHWVAWQLKTPKHCFLCFV